MFQSIILARSAYSTSDADTTMMPPPPLRPPVVPACSTSSVICAIPVLVLLSKQTSTSATRLHNELSDSVDLEYHSYCNLSKLPLYNYMSSYTELGSIPSKNSSAQAQHLTIVIFYQLPHTIHHRLPWERKIRLYASTWP